MYFYALTVYALANLSFGMINTIPDRVLTWTGLPTGLQSGDGAGAVLEQATGAAAGAVNSTGKRH